MGSRRTISKRFPDLVPAQNDSHFLNGFLMNQMDKYYKPDSSVLIIAEPPSVADIFMGSFERLTVSVVNYKDDFEGVPFDMNLPIKPSRTYDYVFSQALLEHICRPSIGIENMANFARPGGYIFIHSHTPSMAVHKWPYDCVRFLPDFFSCLQDYLPIELIESKDIGVDIYAIYRRQEEQ